LDQILELSKGANCGAVGDVRWKDGLKDGMREGNRADEGWRKVGPGRSEAHAAVFDRECRLVPRISSDGAAEDGEESRAMEGVEALERVLKVGWVSHT
jgi:hypothetical protein